MPRVVGLPWGIIALMPTTTLAVYPLYNVFSFLPLTRLRAPSFIGKQFLCFWTLGAAHAQDYDKSAERHLVPGQQLHEDL